MNQAPYPYTRVGDCYTFISKGKNDIAKAVEFTVLDVENVFNLFFGDLLTDGTIDDTVISNNGDAVRVLSTVISIAMDFLDRHAAAMIFFTGSTRLRTAMCHRILRMYYIRITVNFKIIAVVTDKSKLIQINFDPARPGQCFGFFVTKK
jgi:hypothetical protein